MAWVICKKVNNITNNVKKQYKQIDYKLYIQQEIIESVLFHFGELSDSLFLCILVLAHNTSAIIISLLFYFKKYWKVLECIADKERKKFDL